MTRDLGARKLGDTDQESTVVTFGAIALNWLEQEGANQMVENALNHGVNHFDVAPQYVDAELKLGPKLRQHREEIFLGCKTQKREYDGARNKLERSLDRLSIDTIKLYQVHGLEYEEELDTITGEGGALKAFREAKAEGLIDHIGLTSHGDPDLIIDATDRIDNLETLMFPLNPVVMAKTDAEYDYEAVLERANEEGLGTLIIKAFARGSWPSEAELPVKDRPYANWYEPVDTPEEMRERFNLVASQDVTSVVTPGDPKLVSMVFDAASRYEPMDEAAQRSLIEGLRHEDSPVPPESDGRYTYTESDEYGPDFPLKAPKNAIVREHDRNPFWKWPGSRYPSAPVEKHWPRRGSYKPKRWGEGRM